MLVFSVNDSWKDGTTKHVIKSLLHGHWRVTRHIGPAIHNWFMSHLLGEGESEVWPIDLSHLIYF